MVSLLFELQFTNKLKSLKVLKSKEEGKRFPSLASEHFKYLESHKTDSYFLFSMQI